MTDTNDDSPNGGIGAMLFALLERLAELDESHATSEERPPVGRGRIGHDVSISVGTIAPDRPTRPAPGNRTADPGREEVDCTTSVRYGDEEVVVVADLPGVTAEEVSAALDEQTGELAIGRGDAVVERVALRRDDLRIAKSTFNNGVLELRLRETGPDDE